MTIEDLKGIIPPIVTPVDETECVDEVALIRVIDHVLAGGVHGVFVMGSNGEFYAMDKANQKKAIDITVNRVNGRVPVYAGIGAITTRECVDLARQAESCGADAITILPPMFIKLTDDELYDHFKVVADAITIPVLIYNNPGKTANNVTVSLLRKLALIPNIIGVKNTSMDFGQTIQYIDATRDLPDFRVLSGIDFYIFGTLAYGGYGAVAGTANVAPRRVADIYDRWMTGDIAGARQAQFDLIPLRRTYDFGSFPVVMKDALNLMGLDLGHPVRPIQHTSEAKLAELRGVLTDLGLLR